MLVRRNKGPGDGGLLDRGGHQLGLEVANPATSSAGTSKDMSYQWVLFRHSAVVLHVVIVHGKPLYHGLVIRLLNILQVGQSGHLQVIFLESIRL